jgi:hypothetical protein
MAVVMESLLVVVVGGGGQEEQNGKRLCQPNDENKLLLRLLSSPVVR